MIWIIGLAVLSGIGCVLVAAFMRGANPQRHQCATCGDPAGEPAGGRRAAASDWRVIDE